MNNVITIHKAALATLALELLCENIEGADEAFLHGRAHGVGSLQSTLLKYGRPAPTTADLGGPTDLAQLKALALAATPGPWKVITDEHATYAEGYRHKERRIFTAAPHPQLGDIYPVVNSSFGIGENKGDPPRKMVSIDQPNADYIAALHPAVVLDLIARIECGQVPRRPMPPEIMAAIEDAHNTGATSALTASGEAVFINYGHDLGDNAHLECTACGGSGHIEDQKAIAASASGELPKTGITPAEITRAQHELERIAVASDSVEVQLVCARARLVIEGLLSGLDVEQLS